MKLYLAGPMRNRPYFNREAFAQAADVLRARGHMVFSPPEYAVAIYGEGVLNEAGDSQEAIEKFGFEPKKIFLNELAFVLMDAEAIVLLEGWKTSTGAIAERAVALAADIPVIEYPGAIGMLDEATTIN